MVTYDEVLTLGIYYGLIPFFVALGGVMAYAVNRHRKRRWVYLDMQLKSGPSFRKQYPPKKGVVVTKKYGAYAVPMEGQSGTFKGKPLYRMYEGYPYPMVYTRDRIPVIITKKVKTIKDGKEIEESKDETVYQEIVKPMPLAPSSFRFSAYERDRTHGQVYGGAAKLELLLIVIAVLVVIGLLINVAK